MEFIVAFAAAILLLSFRLTSVLVALATAVCIILLWGAKASIVPALIAGMISFYVFSLGLTASLVIGIIAGMIF